MSRCYSGDMYHPNLEEMHTTDESGSFTVGITWEKVETPTYTINGPCSWSFDIKEFAEKVFGYDLTGIELPEPQPQDERGQFLFEFMR